MVWQPQYPMPGPDAAQQLEDGVRHRPFVGHPALYPFGNQFFIVLLEITVFAAVSHSSQRTHAAIDFEASALVDLLLTGGFFAARQQGAQHYHIGARCQGFDNVAGIFDAAVGNDGDIVFGCTATSVIHRR